MRTNTKFAAVALCIGFSVGGHVAAQEMKPALTIGKTRPELAAVQAQRAGDFLLAPVKSPWDLSAYLKSARRSSLDLLSPAAKRRFLASLTFNESGLTGFDYSDLRAELTVSQIYQVLAIFGAQHVALLIKGARAETDIDRLLMSAPVDTLAPPMDDHEGYRCEGGHTCGSAPRHICMSGC